MSVRHSHPNHEFEQPFKEIDALSSVSYAVTEKYLAGEELESSLLRTELCKAVISRVLFPAFAGASRRNMGVKPLIDEAVDYFPARPRFEKKAGFKPSRLT
jgi:translation elongation factor EF-G